MNFFLNFQVQFSPDTRLLASASFDKSVKLWCGRTGRFLHSLRGHVGPVYQIAWSSDSRLLVSGSADSTLKVPFLRILWDFRVQMPNSPKNPQKIHRSVKIRKKTSCLEKTLKNPQKIHPPWKNPQKTICLEKIRKKIHPP